jgi:hypothetical protein
MVSKGVMPAAQHSPLGPWARQTTQSARLNNPLRQRVSRLVRRALSFAKTLAQPIGAIQSCICHDHLTKATV